MKEIIQKGYLEVDEIHELYYEVCGKEDGIPILFIHGGPGAGFDETSKRFFDFTKHKVIFFDQRGASRSKPFGSILNNTTNNLVEDITKLLDYLKIKSVYLFGGSWGTTLSLVYAIQNANRVLGLLLRGIFLGNEDSIQHYLNGGIEKHHPEAWERFMKNVPDDYKNDIPKFYLDKMLNGENRYAYEWAYYEISIFQKNISKEEIEDILTKIPYQSLAILEAHYLANQCFLPEDYILRNADKLIHIPTWIIQGRFDMICPPIYAYHLKKQLANSTIKFVDAGHSDQEANIEKEIDSTLEEINKIEIMKKGHSS